VLHISGVSSCATFWREVQRLRAKNVDGEPRTILDKEGSDSDSVKPDKLSRQRRRKTFSNRVPEPAATGEKQRSKL
jgi:hypothetical protein